MRRLPRPLWYVLAVATAGCAAPKWELEEFRGPWPSRPAKWVATTQPAAATRPSPSLPAEPTVADCLRTAAMNNPGLEASFRGWRAALQRVPQVTALPDPRFSYAWYVREVETRVGPQEHALGLSQMFPWFGKLELRGDAAGEAARAAYARYEAAKLDLFFAVKDAYYEYAYLADAIRITRENQGLIKKFERLARTKYRVGAARHPDVIRAQVELGKIDNDFESLKDLREPLVARLNAVMNRPPHAPIGWPRPLDPAGVQLTDEQLLAWLTEANPDLKRLEAEIRRQRTNVDLAKKDYYPDVTVGLNWVQTGGALMPDTPDDSKDPVVLNFSVNLPVWREKLDAGVREARNRLVGTTRQYEDRRNTLESRLKLVAYRFRDAARQIKLYEQILISKARQSVSASEAGYRAGKVDFLDLLDAQRQLLAFQLAHRRAVANHAQRLAELESLVGQAIVKP